MKSSLNLNISKYPCKYCIVKLQCVTYCDKLDFNESLLNKFKRTQRCFDCGHDSFDIYHSFEDLRTIFRCLDCMRTFTISIWYNDKPHDKETEAGIIRGLHLRNEDLFEGPVSGKYILDETAKWCPEIYVTNKED